METLDEQKIESGLKADQLLEIGCIRRNVQSV